MTLLATLGLRAPKSSRSARVGAAPRTQTTMTIQNAMGVPITLVNAALQFKTARFEGGPPSTIGPHKKATFRIVESTLGAPKTGGQLLYHIDMKRHDANVRFLWANINAKARIEGEGPFSHKVEAVVDSDKGNTYLFIVQDVEDFNADPLQMRIDVLNNSGFDLALHSAELQDSEHNEFREPPPPRVVKGASVSFLEQGLRPESECAGAASWVVAEPGERRHVVGVRWRKGGRPVGTVTPNDGAFLVEGKMVAQDRVKFVIRKHEGPPPEPQKPTKVTIVNNAPFALEQDMLQLDNERAGFNSRPAPTLEGGRRTQFEVEAKDPEFPDQSGIVAYTFRIDGQDGNGPVEHVVAMDWRSEPPPSFARISPPADGVTCEVSGAHPSIVFTFAGGSLDFDPPAKGKEPTLRKGDKSPDGWVEYLQEALNHHINAGLEVDGDFGGQTLKAVKAFQRKHKDEGVLEDGIVGDQTWSFLREGVPQKPRTDGRKPHTFVEKGVEARWVREKQVVAHEAGEDALVMTAICVGDRTGIEGRPVRLRVTSPSGEKKVFERPLGVARPASTTGQGSQHDVHIRNFSTLFDAAAKSPPPGDYTIEGFLDKELGGDSFSETVTIALAP